MKKILHISKYYYPYYGGIEDVAHTIVEELRPYYEQKVICFNHEKGSVQNINGIDVIRVSTFATIASQPLSVKYWRIIQKTIDEFRPDFIHLHLPNPLAGLFILITNLRGAKIISHWHADILGQKGIYPLYKNFERKLLKISDKIIATSQMYVDFSQPLQDFKDKITIIPNTIKDHKFHLFKGEEEEVRKIKAKHGNKDIVLFVGRHVPYKGIEKLIEADSYIKEDCVILIAGTGTKTVDLKALAQNSSRIKFIGRLSDNDLKYYLYASKIFAFPSVNRSEAFGVALAEAMFCGLPAVSFNIEGSGALWVNQNEKTGFVVDDFDSKKYAKAIDNILKSPELQQKFSKNAQDWVKSNFMREQILPLLNEVYT